MPSLLNPMLRSPHSPFSTFSLRLTAIIRFLTFSCSHVSTAALSYPHPHPFISPLLLLETPVHSTSHSWSTFMNHSYFFATNFHHPLPPNPSPPFPCLFRIWAVRSHTVLLVRLKGNEIEDVTVAPTKKVSFIAMVTVWIHGQGCGTVMDKRDNTDHN